MRTHLTRLFHLTQLCQGCGREWVTLVTDDREELVAVAESGQLCDRCYTDEQYARDYLMGES